MVFPSTRKARGQGDSQRNAVLEAVQGRHPGSVTHTCLMLVLVLSSVKRALYPPPSPHQSAGVLGFPSWSYRKDLDWVCPRWCAHLPAWWSRFQGPRVHVLYDWGPRRTWPRGQAKNTKLDFYLNSAYPVQDSGRASIKVSHRDGGLNSCSETLQQDSEV